MARESILVDLVEVTSRVPWWLAAALGGGLFYGFKYVLPTQMSGTYQAALALVFSMFAYLTLSACLLGALIGIAARVREYVVFKRQKSINSIRSLSWPDFERMVTEAFRQQGFKAQRSPNGPDGGVDVVLQRDHQTTLVQCKQWKSSRVGVKPIRELAGVVAAQKADGGIFVCSGAYTAEAKKFATQSRIELFDGERLTKMVAFSSSVPPSNLHTATTAISTCPKCGSGLVRRVARRGKDAGSEFLGCSAFPKCRYTRRA